MVDFLGGEFRVWDLFLGGEGGGARRESGEIEGFKVRALDAASLQRDVTCRESRRRKGFG